jgi:hypothetical protein
VQAQTLTPFNLFASPVRYVVPMFQRPYVWTRELQWEPLWDDIRNLAEDVLERLDAGAGGASMSHDAVPHFLGAVVLDQQLVPAGYIPVRHIIDGQQRLTTLQLLLDAAQCVVERHGAKADASALETLVLNNAAIAQSSDDVFKVWPTNHDRPAFRAAMASSGTTLGLNDSAIVKAHEFFTNEIAEWCEPDGDAAKAVARLGALARALMHYVKLVVIDLEPGDNAQVIFETLNHRGTPLLAADLVKNLVFQRAEGEQEDLEDLYETQWKPFDGDRWRRPTKQGRLYRPRIDIFLNYWLVMQRRKEVPTDRVFEAFREHLLFGTDATRALVAQLRKGAEAYVAMEADPFASVPEAFSYRVLAVMEQHALGPLLLWLRGAGPREVPPDQYILALRSLESWAVRRMLCRMNAKQVNMLVVELLEELAAKGGNDGRIVLEFLAGQQAESRVWPTDDEVRAAVISQPYYQQLTRARLRMVLEALEDAQRSPMTEQDHCPRGKLTIEHVLPQGWREHWQLTDPSDSTAAAERDRLLHTIGNLTLVTDRLNPALSNRPWTDEEAKARQVGDKGKRTLLDEHAVLMLTRPVVKDHPTVWDENAIQNRSASLAEDVIKVWPAPAGLS